MGWKRPLKSSPTIHPTPLFLLNHILKCHIYSFLAKGLDYSRHKKSSPLFSRLEKAPYPHPASSILLNTEAISRCTGLEKMERVQTCTQRGRSRSEDALSIFFISIGSENISLISQETKSRLPKMHYPNIVIKLFELHF